MPVKLRKSEGSGAVDHVPPKMAGYATCSQSVAQPPDECPVRNRPSGFASIRYMRSRRGISSPVSAKPHGPLLTESANSTVPVENDWLSITQIISGMFFEAMSPKYSLATGSVDASVPPKPCVQYTVGYVRRLLVK